MFHCFTMGKEQRELKMYCVLCKKSVLGFDHHCAWLNTCIGARQYPFFLLLSLYGVFLTALQLLVCLMLLVSAADALNDSSSAAASTNATFIEQKIKDVFADNDFVFFLLVGVEAFLSFVALTMFVVLSLFHCTLQFRGYGTYQYLLNKRSRQRSRDVERASRVRMGARAGCREMCCRRKRDAMDTWDLDISRVESTVVKNSIVSGTHETYDVDLNDDHFNKKKLTPTAAQPAVNTDYETSVNA